MRRNPAIRCTDLLGFRAGNRPKRNLKINVAMRSRFAYIEDMKTIFNQTINGKNIEVQMKEDTNSLWLSVDGKDHGKQSDVYAISSVIWDWYQININGPVAKAIMTAEDANKNSNPVEQPAPINMVADALASGDINKYAKGGVL